MARLRDLGLSEYEARAYRALLRIGPTTAKELSRASDVPMGRVYDVLDDLEQYGLVRSQTASRPKNYVAVEPDTALDRLLTDKKRELEAEAERYEAVVDELSDELDANEPIRGQFWTAAVGPEESVDLLTERLTTADERVVLAAGVASSQLDVGEVGRRVTDELEAALERGASVSILLTPGLVDTLPESVGERYRERLADHPEFAVRIADDVAGTCNLVDDVEVCVEVPNPLRPDEAFAVINLKDAEFAESLRSAFDRRWKTADAFSI